MVVIGSGTGGTVTGVARKLKEKCPECKVSWEAGLPAGTCGPASFPAHTFDQAQPHSSPEQAVVVSTYLFFSQRAWLLLEAVWWCAQLDLDPSECLRGQRLHSLLPNPALPSALPFAGRSQMSPREVAGSAGITASAPGYPGC